ncbi:hypothetical protein J2S36_000805 [Arcanobacterium hippocoleae]|uniref:TIGR03089 family protein n=1 Tax=Arcanobacterium hippocoleae TaxID=149017 RepID=A0ABU1T1K7_9ACTO|nr:hypothetical protein [Arcanobacterium hippocoleae]
MKGTAPALTWYGMQGGIERIELSGKVCANHLAKIANYLAMECDLGPDTCIGIDLPPHWKSSLWAMGALLIGAQVRFWPTRISARTAEAFAADGSAAVDPQDFLQSVDVLLTDRPEFWLSELSPQILTDFAGEIIALNLHSLAFSWNGELPSGVLDGQAEVLGQADVMLAVECCNDANAMQFILPVAQLHDLPAGMLLAIDADRARTALSVRNSSACLQAIISGWAAGLAVVIVDDPMLQDPKNVQNLLRSEGFSDEYI